MSDQFGIWVRNNSTSSLESYGLTDYSKLPETVKAILDVWKEVYVFALVAKYVTGIVSTEFEVPGHLPEIK
jgi:hypothetical protein